MEDSIIQLEKGYNEVLKDGIEPFLDFIERQEREFFKAKQFVLLYEYAATHDHNLIKPQPYD
jgi:hypothetical protein